MTVRVIELHVGQFLLSTVAINCSEYPPTYRMALYHGLTTRFEKLKDADELESIPEKVATFERMDYTLKYYLVSVH